MSDGIVRYEEFTEEQYDAEMSRASQLSGSQWAEVKEGDNFFRFIPSPPGGRSPIRSTAVHFIRGMPGTDRVISFNCPLKEINEPCPMCDFVAHMQRSNNAEQKKLAEGFSARLQVLTNVIDRTLPADDPLKGIRVFGYGKSVMEQLKAVRRNARVGGDYYNPTVTGFDVVINRVGTEMSTRYKIFPDRTPSPLHPDPDVAQDLINSAFDLESFINISIPDELLIQMQAQLLRLNRTQGAVPGQLAAPRTVAGPHRTAAAAVGSGMMQRPAPAAAPQPAPGQDPVADADFTEENENFD